MNLRQFFQLLFLSLAVKLRLFAEYLRVVFCYYHNSRFRKADLALLSKYLLRSPYKISKLFLIKKGETDPYTYGETPLTTLDLIVRECGISTQDVYCELGSGRGRGCLWMGCYLNVRAIGIEYIPEFVTKAEQVKESQQIEKVEFLCGDISGADYRAATFLYLYGTCFDELFIKKLLNQFREVPKGTKIVTVSYPLTDYSADFELIKQFEAPFIWGTADVYLHRKI